MFFLLEEAHLVTYMMIVRMQTSLLGHVLRAALKDKVPRQLCDQPLAKNIFIRKNGTTFGAVPLEESAARRACVLSLKIT